MAAEKNNKTLNVPNLRFPEFSGEWEKYLLKSITNIYDGTHQTPKYTKSGVPFISVEDVTQKSSKEQKYISEQDFHNNFRNPPQKGDILMTRIGDIGTPCIVPTNEALGYYVSLALIRPFEKLQSCFLNYVIQSNSFKRELYKRTIHVAFPQKINKEDIGKCKLDVPSIEEQNRIGDLLSLIDERITTQKKIIEKYESLIRGLITSVNKGEICKCKATALKDVLAEVHEKNVENYEVCSVSVSQGVINQIDYLGRSFAAKKVLHYNVVNYGDIVYTKSPTGEFPYGIVKLSNLDRPVAVSPLYGVYRPVNDYVGIYLHLYFKSPVNTKNYLHRLIQKGAKNTINITNQHFLDNKILIPENGWLEIIVNAASTIEKMIQIECNALLCLERQKNYLLSKMFI